MEMSLFGSCFLHSFRHEVVNINLKNKPDWIFEKNPDGLVPVLETSKGQLIYESPITCEYLDEAFPGRKLMPSDPYERALQKMLLEHFSKVLHDQGGIVLLNFTSASKSAAVLPVLFSSLERRGFVCRETV